MSDPEKAAPNGAASTSQNHNHSNGTPDGAIKPDIESQSSPSKIPHWRMILDQGVVVSEIEHAHYEGAGTEEDPYVVKWMDNDTRNPFNWSYAYRWSIVLFSAFAVLTVALCSSAFSGGLPQILGQYHVSEEIGILGLSLFVLGFALGPLIWAPLSEMYGRQILFAGTFGAYTLFNAGAAGSQNIQTIIILRFFAGAFGSSPLTNSGGVIADCFPAKERGLAMSIFAAAPFMGPALGPIIGGFLGEAAGWRWVLGLLAAVSGVGWILGMLAVPETYAPVLLRKRAEKLSKMTGKVYVSKLDLDRGKTSLIEALRTALIRPWILLFREPIVLLLSLYMSIIYGVLYMLFSAYPIVYQQGRGWSQGIGGLAFLGVLIGMLAAVLWNIFLTNPRYLKATEKHGGFAPPEERLPPCMIGGIFLPIGLFWFAWTNSPSLPWAASMAAGIPFGFGMVLVFLSIMNYLIDAYTVFAASVLAASAVLRSLFGAAFPLFTTQMYTNLGIHWASSIPAFLALACVPFPFLFYKYGGAIRARCKFARESEQFLKRMRGEQNKELSEAADEYEEEGFEEVEKEDEEERERRHSSRGGGVVNSGTDENMPRFERIRTGRSSRARDDEWDDNPYVIDRVHTRESFKNRRSTSSSRK